MTTATKKTLHGISLRPRQIITPKATVRTTTTVEKQKVVTSARRVINDHRAVLIALRDR